MNQKIYSLKLFRVMSCIGVVLVHYGQRASLNGIFRTITDFGAYGVYMFFIISGFLGYLSYSNSHSCKEYYVRRFSRVLPLYYCIIIYDFILYECILHGHFIIPADSSHLKWLRYFLLLSQCIPSSDNFWINLSATWTISCFILFYLSVPFLFKFIDTFYKALGFGFFCFVLNRFWSIDWFLPITELYFFAHGILIYLALKEHRQNSLLVICCTAITFFLLFNYDQVYVFSEVFVILIIASRDFAVNNQFMNRFTDLLDEYSFAVYLVHAIIIEAIDLINRVYLLSPLQILIVLITGTVFISFLLHKFIERPFYERVNVYYKRWAK